MAEARPDTATPSAIVAVGVMGYMGAAMVEILTERATVEARKRPYAAGHNRK
jgi:hypothetical protein